MLSMLTRRAASVLVVMLAMLAACGGGSGAVTITFRLTNVSPTTSLDLNGGDVVTITGSGFDAIIVARVRFESSIGFNVVVLSDTQIQVTAPPAPFGVPGSVTITVESLENGQQQLFNAYSYVDALLPPNPQTIFPTNFTPTGAEQFTIQGSNLGQPGGVQNVNFLGVGMVLAQVSPNGQLLTGNAPVFNGQPLGVPVTVRVEPQGMAAVPVPAAVNFVWSSPTPIAVGFQTGGNASEPVRLADGYAALCTAGTDNIWGNANDTIVIISGPPNPVAVVSLPVGYLSAVNSIPAVMDQDTFCVYSIGADATVSTFDDVILHVSQAQSAAPVVTPVGCPFMNSAPLVAIAPNRIATTAANGAGDGIRGTLDDEIVIVTFTGVLANVQVRPNSGPMDPTGGPGAFSLPVSLDGEHVYLATIGPDGIPRNGDDTLVRIRVSQFPGAGYTSSAAPFLAGRPIAVAATVLAAPGGSTGPAGGPNDVLTVFDDTGGALTPLPHPLGTRIQVAAARPYCAFGAGGILVSTAGPDTAYGTFDEVLRAYTDPLANVFRDVMVPGRPVLAPVGNGGIVTWDGTLSPAFVDAQATFDPPLPFFPVIAWPGNVAPLADQNRAFVIENGPDATPSTGDEGLLVYQSLSVTAPGSGSLLPLAQGVATRLTTLERFVPIGANWGLVQSPGPNGTFGNADDQLILARY